MARVYDTIPFQTHLLYTIMKPSSKLKLKFLNAITINKINVKPLRISSRDKGAIVLMNNNAIPSIANALKPLLDEIIRSHMQTNTTFQMDAFVACLTLREIVTFIDDDGSTNIAIAKHSGVVDVPFSTRDDNWVIITIDDTISPVKYVILIKQILKVVQTFLTDHRECC